MKSRMIATFQTLQLGRHRANTCILEVAKFLNLFSLLLTMIVEGIICKIAALNQKSTKVRDNPLLPVNYVQRLWWYLPFQLIAPFLLASLLQPSLKHVFTSVLQCSQICFRSLPPFVCWAGGYSSLSSLLIGLRYAMSSQYSSGNTTNRNVRFKNESN